MLTDKGGVVAQRPLEGRVAIVTGSGRGIGRAEALVLAREGARIIVSDFGTNAEGQSTACAVAAEICAEGGQAIGVSENLMTAVGAGRTVEAAVEHFGGLDILVNNAGLRGGNPVDELTEEQWDSVVDSHLKAAFLLIRRAVPLMRERGGGVIINTGSEAGLGMPFNAAYAAAKEGLAGLTRSVAREQGTGGGDWFQKKLQEEWNPLIVALGRYWIGERGASGWDKRATPDSIAAFVAWLCMPAASNVNGRDFYVGGDEIAMLSPPEFVSTLLHEGGWTVDALQRFAPSLTGALEDPFRLLGYVSKAG